MTVDRPRDVDDQKRRHIDDLKGFCGRYFCALYVRVLSLPWLPTPANWQGERLFDSRQKDLGKVRSKLLSRVLRTDFRHDFKTEIYEREDRAEQHTQSTTSDVYPYTRLVTEHHIRVLMLQPGERGKPLVASFQLIDYNDATARYHALSYTWGTATPNQSIEIDGYTIAITQNLYDALQHMRFRDKILGIWVDAVSINQQDNDERASQVGHMGDIYTNAYAVLIWLGNTTDKSKEVFDLLSSIKYLSQSKVEVPFFMTDDPFLLNKKILTWQGGNIPRSDDLLWKEMEQVLWRPWWTRTWTKQEVCLAKYAFFFCGTIIFQVDELLDAAHFMTTHGMAAAASLELQHVMGILDMRNASKRPDKPSLLQLLFDTRSALATNPVDKIYGLLGLCRKEDAKAINVDYTLSTARVYKDYARSILESGSLDLLSAVCDDRWREIKCLPSWVPDWSVPPRAQEFITPNRAIVASATGDSKPSIRFSEDGSQLFVKGEVFDTVEEVTRPLMPPIIDTSSIIYFSAKKRKKLEQSNAMSLFLLGGFRLKQWERFAYRSKTYPTSENVRTAYINTITANLAPLDVDILHAYGCYGRMRLLATPKRVMNEEDSRTSMRFKDWVERASYGRTFFKTTKGYFGLGPLSTRKGDSVILLAGAKTPFVLASAKEPGQHILRGECYVHGIMFGEAWNDNDTLEEFCLL